MENNNFLKYLYLLTLIKIIPGKEDSLYIKNLTLVPIQQCRRGSATTFLSGALNYHAQYFTSVLLRSTGSERSKAGHEEMKTGEGNHVDSQLS